MNQQDALETITIDVDTYVVLWSPHQKAFHIETVGEMIRHNREIFAQEGLADYIVLNFAKSRADAQAFANEYKYKCGDAVSDKPREAESVESITKRLFAS